MRTLGPLLLVFAAACGSDDPADVEGDFTVNITNRDNGCNLANWTVGDTSSGISVAIAQDGEEVTATINGLVGGYVNLALGSNVFAGEIAGNQLDLDLFGTRTQMSASCVYTYNAKIVGDVENDTIAGRVEYRSAPTTPQNPDCAAIQGCLSYQEFNGTRPPT